MKRRARAVLLWACAFQIWMSGVFAATIAITEIQGLSFPAAVAGTTTTMVTAATDSTAAVFNATGDANTALTATIVETGVIITTGTGSTNSQKISIDNWTFGGSLTDGGGSGTGTFDATGALTNLRIGATANVESDDIAGDYTGTVTLRLVYS